MSIGMILHLLAQDRTMLIEALLGNILICIVVYTLFGKRKYDWFFPAACAVRYIFYNIGLLSIWNAMYGTQNWYKITMSTCATATALILVIITAILWKEPLSKVMVGVFAAECINDGILYQVMKMKLPIIQECFLVVFIFTVLYFIVRPLLKKYRTYMNIKECLKVDAYQKVESTDGSFEFAYPKYVFNDYDIDDVNNDYNFYYKDEDENIKMQMRVYTEEYEGNPVEKARELYDNFCSRATEVLYQIEPKDEIDGQGMARTIVAGKFDYEDADTCVYYVGASDENRDYIMEFYYPDANPEYDYDDVNYILDCVYRYCSFAGGTYKPRSYEMFLQDDMGVKK